MTPNDLRRKYIDFFIQHGHVEVPSAPLVPENDSTTLFTSAGMQPLVPYLLGQPHPSGKRLVNSQKSFRSQDIEEVGDNRHTTFFEMLGNWSLGDYFKKEQLTWVFEFLTQALKLDPQHLYVTVFRGNDAVPRDTEAVEIWKSLFASVDIKAKDVDVAEHDGMQDGRIFYYDEKKNWWSRSGVPSAMPPGEPGGPSSEVFYDFGVERELHAQSPFKDQLCHVNCDCGRFSEIGNSVFMQYQKQADDSLKELAQKNVDFGGGFERILSALNDDPDVFITELFQPILSSIEVVSGKKYEGENKRNFRIIADHIRAATFLIKDGVQPSNKQQGYVLRRLIRRATFKLFQLEKTLNEMDVAHICECVIKESYKGSGYFIDGDEEKAKIEIFAEVKKFKASLHMGLKQIEKQKTLDGTIAFTLYETFGFPFELTEEIARERGQQVEYGTFRKAFEEHQQQSRTASKGMFKGGLADHSETVTKYHTVTHLLHAALRKVLGTHVSQQGSNLTSERLRFDFSHTVALTEQQETETENMINQWISEDLPVHHQTMSKEEALKQGALAFFQEKYGDQVSVYTIGKDPEKDWISKELCGGPHVTHTGEIGLVKIFKEEAIGSGKRRIYVKLKTDIV